ncbi:Peroxisomal membrane signal receptor PTS1 [Tulasnella sp. 331]|nr:Peroxisomal membrane signal receptor PTS1 [Tulasnella sp. 331]KAG8877524.1 Peroxisomal membrane signal receptor PTS1 [Tulasnella sp. 332]
MVKHAEVDRSLQNDRIGPVASGSELRHLPSSSTSAPSAADAAMARQFFEGGASGTAPMQHIAPFQIPRGIAMGSPTAPHASMMRDTAGPSLHDAWAKGTTNASDGLQGAWSRAAPSSQQSLASPLRAEQQMPMAAHHMPAMALTNSAFMSAPMMMMRPSGPIMLPQAPQSIVNWDQEFSKVADDVKGKGKARIVEVDSTTTGLEDAFRELSAAKDQTALNDDHMSDFEKAWRQMKLDSQDPSELAKWEAEYRQVLQAQREDGETLGADPEYDFGTDMRNSWEQKWGKGLNSDYEEDVAPPRTFDQNGEPILSDYPFEINNQYLGLPGPTLLERAKESLANNGSLSEAALMLEASIQKGELGEGGYEVWILLGETRSMDEREDIGLLALRQGVKFAKQASQVGPGMLARSLAISYTNEGYELAATNILREWLMSRFPTSNLLTSTAPHSLWHDREETTAAFIRVAQDLHAQNRSDPDVQTGLGVLHYCDQEYDKAKDCFESALWVRPEDYLLWNRLGSCLSNGNQPEEALNVYREALRLRPTYTRAIFNVGVACLNIGAYKEAAEHFLSALAAQRTESGGAPPVDMSEGKNEQLWKTLKKVFALMERDDLAEMTNSGDVEVFRSHGFDF